MVLSVVIGASGIRVFIADTCGITLLLLLIRVLSWLESIRGGRAGILVISIHPLETLWDWLTRKTQVFKAGGRDMTPSLA